MIGGLIIEGVENQLVLIRGRGPSMGGSPFNVPGTLPDPYLTLYSGSTIIAENDNWQDPPMCDPAYVCLSPPDILLTGLDPCQPNPGQVNPPPGCNLEAAILIYLPPGAYTGILNGVGGGTGVGLVEIFEQD